MSERGPLLRAFGRGPFPHQWSWLIDNPVRRLFITPTRLANRLPLTTASHVLEIGPGSGYFSAELARRIPEGRLELLDVQQEMLTKARSRLESLGCTHVGYTAQDAATELPYADRAFDVILLVAVLGEVTDPRTCLRGLRRVLRRDGVLVVHEHVPDPDRIPLRRLQPLLTECGYRLDARHGPGWNYTAVFRLGRPS